MQRRAVQTPRGQAEDAAGLRRNGTEGIQRTLLQKARACLHPHCCAHFWSSFLERNTGGKKIILGDGSYFTGKFHFIKIEKIRLISLKGKQIKRDMIQNYKNCCRVTLGTNC